MRVIDRPLLFFSTPDEWQSWLEQNLDHNGVRLQLRKKGSTKPGIRYAEALDVALCFGWIDGQAGSLDADYYTVGFSPRRARSIWSQINREHVARLIAEGRMRAPGLAQVDAAKADGRWDAAYGQKDAPIPDDLALALAANPRAAAAFQALGAQNRFAILFRLANAKKAQTRASRLATYVEMLERGESLV